MIAAPRRYGAILWDVAAEIDDAITFVRIFEDPNEAIRMLSVTCVPGQRWAVVDLGSKVVVAEGAARFGAALTA